MTVVERKRGLLVVGVFKRSPAKRAGIKPGDLITKVNGRSIAGESSDVSTARIKGKPGTYVRLTISGRRPGADPAREARADQGSGRELAAADVGKRAQRPAVEARRREPRLVHLGRARATLGERDPQAARRGAEGFVLDLRATAAACSTRPS